MLSISPSMVDLDASMGPLAPLPAPAIVTQDDQELTTGLRGDHIRLPPAPRAYPTHIPLSRPSTVLSTLSHSHANDALSIAFTDPNKTSAIFGIVTKGRLGRARHGASRTCRHSQPSCGGGTGASLAGFISHFEARVRNRHQAELGLAGILVSHSTPASRRASRRCAFPVSSTMGNRAQAPSGLGLRPSRANGNDDRWTGLGHNECDPWREAGSKCCHTSAAVPDSSQLVAGAAAPLTFHPASWPTRMAQDTLARSGPSTTPTWQR